MLAASPVAASMTVVSFDEISTAARLPLTLASLCVAALSPQADRQRLTPATMINALICFSESANRQIKKEAAGASPAASLNVWPFPKEEPSSLHHVVRGGRCVVGSVSSGVGGIRSSVCIHRSVRVHGHVGVHGVVDNDVVSRQVDVVDVHRVVGGLVAAASRNRQGRTGDQDKSTHS